MNLLLVRGIIIILCGVGGITGGIVTTINRNYHEVSLSIPQQTKVAVYKDIDGDDTFSYDPSKPPVLELTGNQKVKMKKGRYISVASDKSHQFTDPVINFTITDSTDSVELMPTYTEAKLDSLLGKENAVILKALQNKYPNVKTAYAFGSIKLYQSGQWGGVTLHANDPAGDTLRLVLHKTDEGWELSTKPEISLGQPVYPDIPLPVLKAVNLLP